MNRKIKIAYLFFLLVGFLVLSASINISNPPVSQFKYVGVDKCGAVCHKGDSKGRQLEIWQDSKHSQAYKTLQSAVSDSIATAWGSTTAAVETPECLKCHILGKEIIPEELEETFDKTQGVQCETCHGPGSEYKKLSIMKDKQASIENGLNVPSDNAAFCKNCHNERSPYYKEFVYEEFWEKIKHPKP